MRFEGLLVECPAAVEPDVSPFILATTGEVVEHLRTVPGVDVHLAINSAGSMSAHRQQCPDGNAAPDGGTVATIHARGVCFCHAILRQAVDSARKDEP